MIDRVSKQAAIRAVPPWILFLIAASLCGISALALATAVAMAFGH